MPQLSEAVGERGAVPLGLDEDDDLGKRGREGEKGGRVGGARRGRGARGGRGGGKGRAYLAGDGPLLEQGHNEVLLCVM